jgi:hypothetical protein
LILRLPRGPRLLPLLFLCLDLPLDLVQLSPLVLEQRCITLIFCLCVWFSFCLWLSCYLEFSFCFWLRFWLSFLLSLSFGCLSQYYYFAGS